jgi:hypothetical protein
MRSGVRISPNAPSIKKPQNKISEAFFVNKCKKLLSADIIFSSAFLLKIQISPTYKRKGAYMLVNEPRFGAATFIWGADFSRHGNQIKKELGKDVEFSKIGDDAALFTSDLELEQKYRALLGRLGVQYDTGKSSSFEEYQQTRE